MRIKNIWNHHPEYHCTHLHVAPGLQRIYLRPWGCSPVRAISGAPWPIPSMGRLLIYLALIIKSSKNVGDYTIHGCYWQGKPAKNTTFQIHRFYLSSPRGPGGYSLIHSNGIPLKKKTLTTKPYNKCKPAWFAWPKHCRWQKWILIGADKSLGDWLKIRVRFREFKNTIYIDIYNIYTYAGILLHILRSTWNNSMIHTSTFVPIITLLLQRRNFTKITSWQKKRKKPQLPRLHGWRVSQQIEMMSLREPSVLSKIMSVPLNTGCNREWWRLTVRAPTVLK